MDFTKILDAIDIIVNQKLTEAAFTRFINGTIVEIVNSEQNTYKVTTDSGKTNFIAQAIAADIDGGIVYEKNDEVKLLQLNGSNNSNENIYILGHSVDFTKQDLNEIKNHFIENVSQKITLNDKYTYILENSSDVIKDIKLKGSFGIKAQIKYKQNSNNDKKNYGFKISFKDKNNANLLTYNLDVNTMIGEPYKFTDFVLQKIEKYLINTFIIDKINSIVIQAFNTDDFEYKDLEIYSAIWTEDENEYQITFKNPTRVDYITTKENGKEEFSLQAILLKNNKTFATNTCKYLWFIQDASIDNNSDAYSSYGGEGWKLLNTVEEITYLNIHQEQYVEDVIKNDIGSCLKITNENTTSYHNYCKCVVLYNGLIIKSQVKHILNLDAAGDINFRLGTLTEAAAAAQEIALLDEKNNTYTEDGFYLGFIFNNIKEDDNYNYEYEVVITRTNSIDDNNDKQIFSTKNNTLLNKNNQYYKILEKQIYENVYPSYTYNCVISMIKEDIKTTLQTIEKTYYVLDSEVREIVQYYNNKGSVVMPDFSIIKEDEWVDNYEELNSGRNWETINIIGRKRLNIQTEWEYFWAFIQGSSQTANLVEEFNRLTKNGKDRGLYYGSGFKVTEDIKPQKEKTYYIYNEKESKYEEQKPLTEFDPTKTYYEVTKDLALFINADYIQTGTLRVGNESNEKFFASITNDKVSIGGFTVDEKSLQWKDKKDNNQYVYLGQEGLKLGNNFAVDQHGNVSWNANNSPQRQKYGKTNNKDFNNSSFWHFEIKDDDIYYIISGDGGSTWAGPFLIQGQQGESGRSIKNTINYYLATKNNSSPGENDSNWKENLSQTNFNEQYRYLWLKQKISYSKEPLLESNIYLCSVWGEKGISGNDGKGIKQTIVKYICLDENTIPDKMSEWQLISEADARNNLTASAPVLWKWIQFLFTDKTTEDSIFILDRLKQNTFIKYADMDAFEPDEYDNNKKGFFSQTRDIEIQSEKIYYVYNSETKKYLKVENPEKENLKSYYEFLVLKSDKDIYAVATANTGWIGTYIGYNVNPSFSDYIWSYYLTELNRKNFMTKVLEEAKDDQGKDVDGIYTYTSTIDGKNYIGITASAIRTGNLNADLITTGTLNADLIKIGSLLIKKDDNTYCNFDITNRQVVLIAPQIIETRTKQGEIIIIKKEEKFTYDEALFYLDSSKVEVPDKDNPNVKRNKSFSINTENLKLNSEGKIELNEIKTNGIEADALHINQFFYLEPGTTLVAKRNNKGDKSDESDDRFYLGCLNPSIIGTDLYQNEYGLLWKNCSYTSDKLGGGKYTIKSSASIIFPWFPSGADIEGSSSQTPETKFKLKIELLRRGSEEPSEFKISLVEGSINRIVTATIYLHLTGAGETDWITSKGPITFNIKDGTSQTFYIKNYFNVPFFHWGINGISFFKNSSGKENNLYYAIQEFGNQDSQTVITKGSDYIGFLISGNLLPYYGDPLEGGSDKKYNLGCNIRPWEKAYINQLYLHCNSNTNELFNFRWRLPTDANAKDYRVVLGDQITTKGGTTGYQLIAVPTT